MNFLSRATFALGLIVVLTSGCSSSSTPVEGAAGAPGSSGAAGAAGGSASAGGASGAAGAAGAGGSGASPLSLSALDGSWAAPACLGINAGGMMQYLKLSFVFQSGTWTHTTRAFADPGCSQMLYDAVITGQLSLGPASSAVAGATEAKFGIAQVTMTPSVPPLVMAFDMQMCGGKTDWAAGTAGDVGQTGCLFVQSTTACPAEYDLVSIDAAGALHFGVRPMMGDLCAEGRRPQTLDPNPFVKM